jgi:hypothetical protein
LARCLIIACGCRGLMLASELITSGHAVRGTTRDPESAAAIEAVGAEAVIADPDRVSTLVQSLAQVAVAVILLGSATGRAEEIAALHGSRLEMLLTQMVDTTVRGVVYEATGSVERSVLDGGAARVLDYAHRSRAHCELLSADPEHPAAWLGEASGAVGRVLEAR